MLRSRAVPFYVAWALLQGSFASATSAGSCYDMTTHVVTCDVAESECNSDYWYEPGYVSVQSGCCHCRASCENISDACSYYDDTDNDDNDVTTTSTYGCYNVSTHQCACDGTEEECDASGGTWTDGCTLCTATSAYGCYDISTHQCACDSTEEECTASGGTWTDGCSSCNGGTTMTTTENMSSASMRLKPGAIFLVVLACALFAADAGTGCYDHIDTHQCDCTVDEEHCTEVRGHTWTDGCRSCDAALGVNHPDCDREHSWGCFDQEAHACECTISQVECNLNMSSGMSWTHQCWSCCHHSVWGCYMPGSGCLCDITEGACNRDFPKATWSFRCHECMGIDADPTLTGDDDGGPHVLVWVIVSCAALVLLAVSASVTAYCMWQRKKKADVARSPGPGGQVVVGTPLGANGDSAAPNPVGKPQEVAQA